jgi:nitronate monooxygenase
MTQEWPGNALAARLGIEYPLIQGPLNGLPTQHLTAAVSEFGALGSFGAHGLAPAAIQEAIAQIRSLTSRPFAVNLWVSVEDEGARSVDAERFERSARYVSQFIEKLGGVAPRFQPYAGLRFEQQVRVLLDANVAAFSFICGIPNREILEECRRRGICIIGAATTPDEARVLETHGVEVIVASGFEAGGHRGSFLRPAEHSLMGIFSLLPQVVDAVSVPVVAAGGIANARGVLAALALGAQGVQLGTAFVATEESGAHPLHRAMLGTKRAEKTSLTRNLTGRWARGVENELLARMNAPDVQVLPYPLQRSLVRSVTAAAEKAGDAEHMVLWAGQSAALCREKNATQLLRDLIDETSTLAGPLSAWARTMRKKDGGKS